MHLRTRSPTYLLAALALMALLAGGLAAQPSASRALAWLEQRVAEQRSDAPPVVVLLSYRDDYNRGVRWSPEDVVGMLRRRSDSYLAFGSFDPGYPVGSPLYRALGAKVNHWQRAIAEWNAENDPDIDGGRLCIDWRPDLVFKHIDGSAGESGCGSLLDENQCAPAPCSAHADNPCTRWEGDMARDWGPSEARFDTGWLLRTPVETWKTVVTKYYDGQDFCDGSGHQWGETTHRRAICRENTPERKVVLYGKTDPRRRRLAFVSGVAIDLRIPEAREWNARRLLSRLVDFGFDPGEPGCVWMGYKPGLWSHYDGPNPARPCPADEANSWSGFETPENAAGCWGGAFVPTPYGPGEFERAMNEQMRVVFRLLDAPVPERIRRRGKSGEHWGPIRFVTTERPETRGRIWWIWEPDVRDRLLGEMRNEPTGLSRP